VPPSEALSVDRFLELLRGAGFPPDDEWYRAVFAAIDMDGDGSVSFSTLVRGLAAMDARAEDTDERCVCVCVCVTTPTHPTVLHAQTTPSTTQHRLFAHIAQQKPGAQHCFRSHCMRAYTVLLLNDNDICWPVSQVVVRPMMPGPHTH
jgi:hypothetical protein